MISVIMDNKEIKLNASIFNATSKSFSLVIKDETIKEYSIFFARASYLVINGNKFPIMGTVAVSKDLAPQLSESVYIVTFYV